MSNKNTNFYNEELYKFFLLGVAFSGTQSVFTNKPTAGVSRINSGITEDGVVYVKRE